MEPNTINISRKDLYFQIGPFLGPVTLGALPGGRGVGRVPPPDEEPPVHTLPVDVRVEGHAGRVAAGEADVLCLQTCGIWTGNVYNNKEG